MNARIERALFAAVFTGLGGVVGYGGAVITMPEPTPRTVMLDIPPACLAAFAAVDQGIKHWENADTHVAKAIASTDGLMPALLIGDAKKAAEIYEASDDAKRDAVDESAKRDSALAEYGQLVAKCAPERPE